ncbi:MAG: SelB C-terminal domain-containing protein, partial [Thermoguttaceae bacterium]
QSPESPGPAAEQLRQSSAIDKSVFDGLVARLKNEGRLVETNQRLALPGHRSTFRDEDAGLLDKIEALFREQGFHPPSFEEISRHTGGTRDKVEKIIKILREHGRLVEVEKGVLFHAEAVDRAREILIAHLQKDGRLESVQFKYLLDTTRKFALPMLDYLDRLGLTRRVGNTRFPKELI